ncbi:MULTISPECIES: glutathionylspermidine synthase family protein [Micromonospora]|uniref:Glutathionylspermidine synthase family protein n=1 Tax=Micromonospora chalcea TaxID=1874 RepID=A0ABX9XVK9_MICCH|nr:MULTISPECIES: glutathionylspermidine synthase family protein [Micromonospora]EWM67305.1 glutathionylspermidine synthase [Micromonospora sp. M42]MCK1808092.1 glutathionylspermidine synthase family protein [Micromonospora sp. R42106]MCK1832755.1 glutathionylspermidine synthase family protein [Micromonospora sp. R42003]MCK1844989.1 glutathionylspermidine synthase family protein [Micromonospora sp. R42004]MCM1016838.1 glutathionylspermidine synthase family protein [Micromonospora sp. XM-20-01]
MRREASTPRPGWDETIRAQGLVYVDTELPDGNVMSYWDETAAYSFTLDEVLRLEEATEELHRMSVAAAEHVVARNRYAEFGIPEWAAEAVARSLRESPPTLYGRFDLWYDGSGPPKMLEYNADTPTALVEASIVQWYWLEHTRPDADQWNSLHERLVGAWAKIGAGLHERRTHVLWSEEEESGEDQITAGYLAETARQAGLDVTLMPIQQVGWDGRRFVDADDRPITTCFKLYPWEWMLAEPYGRPALDPGTPTTWIEPAWKLLLSNKALLAVLWELYPGHDYLLPAYLDSPRGMTEYVAKPLLGREGGSVRIVTADTEITNPGIYGDEGFCFQEFRALPEFEGNRTVLGSWIVDGESAGAGVRESESLITDGYARFLPHYIDAPRLP